MFVVGVLAQLRAFCVDPSFFVWSRDYPSPPSLSRDSIFGLLWKVKILKKVNFFARQVLHGIVNTSDRVLRKVPSLVGAWFYILCRGYKDLDHVL